jgi:uncharacterized membrane protein YbhN (UPF0104 family)
MTVVTRGRRAAALRAGGLLLAAAGCVALARHVDLGRAFAALAAASPWVVALALLVNLGPRTAVRVRRTLVLLRTAPEGRIAARALVPVMLASYAAGYLVPGPAEELFSGASLTRFGFRPRDLVSISLIDKALGVVSVGLVAAPLLPAAAMAPGILAAAGALALGVFGAWLSRARRAIRWRVIAEALACLVASNFASVAILCLSLTAVGAPVSLRTALEIFAMTSCACILPLTPGHLGVFEAAFTVAATHRGVPASAALAAAVIYHGAHIVPLVAAGLPSLIRISLANRRAAHPAPEPEACALPS